MKNKVKYEMIKDISKIPYKKKAKLNNSNDKKMNFKSWKYQRRWENVIKIIKNFIPIIKYKRIQV